MFVESVRPNGRPNGTVELINMEAGGCLRLGYNAMSEYQWEVSILHHGSYTVLGSYTSQAAAQRVYDDVKSKWVGQRNVFTYRYGC